ncbi:hypothetical protein [Rhodoflexus caldus]|uniref:hypothetical protein n=1 Tax=Rhodoflexus caldus TaxID=2891236 RepID=UPI002029B876|nr:hypothetical protein [Rhodoflexus caldus]
MTITLARQTAQEAKQFEAFLRQDSKAYPGKYHYEVQKHYSSGGAVFRIHFHNASDVYFFARREEKSHHGI